MHGQKRSEYKSRLLHPETSSKLSTKAQQWNHLSKELSTQRRRLFRPVGGSADEPAVDDDASAEPSPAILLALTEKMLSVNPDPSHLWNVRREMLLYTPPPASGAAATARGDAADDNIAAENADGSRSSVSSANNNNNKNNNSRRPSSSPPIDIGAELTLTAHCLQRNPKAYSSWFHRKWSLVYYLTHPPPPSPAPAISQETQMQEEKREKGERAQKEHLIGMKAILRSELDLCAQFLQMDERNFHCWNHRRFVVGVLGSCGGGGGGRPSSSAQEDSEIIVEFGGSWSSWTTNRSKLMSMGGQLSHDAIDATGNVVVPSDDDTQLPGGGGGRRRCAAVARSISPLSREELDEIIEDEWNFTTSKIQDNFSNGSAFHYRSKLLPLILESRLSSSSSDAGVGGGDDDGDDDGYDPAERYGATLSLAREEWEGMLLNAVFTEPDDQTPWWYHRFILSWTKPSEDTDDELVKEYEALLFEMADSLRELLEVEKENNDVASSSGGGSGAAESKDESKGAKCKWAYIGLHLVLSTLLESKSLEEEEASELREEARECLAELIKIDPNRKERYQNLTAEIKDA